MVNGIKIPGCVMLADININAKFYLKENSKFMII